MKRHELDPLALVVGLLFLVVGCAYLVAELGDSEVEARWVMPVALVTVGLAGLVSSLVSVVRRRDGRTDGKPDQATESSERRDSLRTDTAESGWSENTPSTPSE